MLLEVNKPTSVNWACKNCGKQNQAKIKYVCDALCQCGTQMGNTKPNKKLKVLRRKR